MPTEQKLPVLLRSFLLSRGLDKPIPHAFTTRLGGVSAAPFDTLNFGNPGDLPPERKDPMPNILENRHRVLTAIGLTDREAVEVWQVHGPAVHVIRRGLPARNGPHDTKADAIVSDDPTRVFAVRVADCAPVLLAARDGRVVGAVHAGWRGVIAGVLPAAIAAMQSLGAIDIAAAIGPCIGVDAFEVGQEVADAFRRCFADDPSIDRIVRPPTDGSGKPHIDLRAALRAQLLNAGVSGVRIETLTHCTHRDVDLCYSHRRDGLNAGRMWAVIGTPGK